MPRKILFLCTGNYYRSRFAEAVFNDLACKAGIDFIAFSRALAIELGHVNKGPISMHARQALEHRGIKLPEPVPNPRSCEMKDLEDAYRIIALKQAEHRRYLTERYPAWPDRVEYWNVHDLDQATPDEALREIEHNVMELVDELKNEKT